MIIGQGSTIETLSADSVRELLASALQPMPLDGERVLVIIPDGTRTAPIPLLFRLLYEQIGRRVARLDYLIALGTHQPMSEDKIDRLIGVMATEREREENERRQKLDTTWHASRRGSATAGLRGSHGPPPAAKGQMISGNSPSTSFSRR
jgi:Lactate racemase N-terminal domain